MNFWFPNYRTIQSLIRLLILKVLVLLPEEQATLYLATEMVRVAERRVSVLAGFPDERLHAFRTARFRCRLLDEDQGIAAD